MFDVLPRSLFNGGNGGIQLSYPYDTALSPTICNGVQNHLAPKTLHSYFTLFKLLYASSIHTRSSSPHVTDHVSQLAQEDFVSEQKSQAVMNAMSCVCSPPILLNNLDILTHIHKIDISSLGGLRSPKTVPLWQPTN